MLIILNIKAHVPCAQLHAIADEDEKSYRLHYRDVRQIRFWHNERYSSLTADKAPDVYDNDQYIAFRSDVPFDKFCEVLAKSEFNTQIDIAFSGITVHMVLHLH